MYVCLECLCDGRVVFFFQAEDGIRDAQESRGLGDVYKRQVGHRIIDQGGPGQGEDQKEAEFYPFHIAAGDKRDGDDGKHGLKDHEGQSRDAQPLLGLQTNSGEAQKVQAADKAADIMAEGQAVAI